MHVTCMLPVPLWPVAVPTWWLCLLLSSGVAGGRRRRSALFVFLRRLLRRGPSVHGQGAILQGRSRSRGRPNRRWIVLETATNNETR